MTPVLRTIGLSKRYGSVEALRDLNLELEPSEVFGYIGPNGAGKTTTIRLLLDFIRPTSGSATIFGLDTRQSAVEIHSRTGYLPADLALFDRLTGSQLFEWVGRLRGQYDRSFVQDLVQRLDLDPSRAIETLSTGNRQKVGVVLAFMHRPELLILDEPTSGLDPLVRREFRALMDETRDRGATVLMSSHELAEVEDMCDRVGIVVDGRLRTVEAVADLRKIVRRHFRVTLLEAWPLHGLQRIPQVSNLVVGSGTDRCETVIECDVTGSPDQLLKEISRHQVLDLVSEPMSLEAYFLEEFERVNGDGRIESVAASPQEVHRVG